MTPCRSVNMSNISQTLDETSQTLTKHPLKTGDFIFWVLNFEFNVLTVNVASSSRYWNEKSVNEIYKYIFYLHVIPK